MDDDEVVNIASVKDAIHTPEGIEDLGPEFVAGFGDVGVRDQADAHRCIQA